MKSSSHLRGTFNVFDMTLCAKSVHECIAVMHAAPQAGRAKILVFCDESKCVYRECALELDAPHGKIKRCSIGSARRRWEILRIFAFVLNFPSKC